MGDTNSNSALMALVCIYFVMWFNAALGFFIPYLEISIYSGQLLQTSKNSNFLDFAKIVPILSTVVAEPLNMRNSYSLTPSYNVLQVVSSNQGQILKTNMIFRGDTNSYSALMATVYVLKVFDVYNFLRIVYAKFRSLNLFSQLLWTSENGHFLHFAKIAAPPLLSTFIAEPLHM